MRSKRRPRGLKHLVGFDRAAVQNANQLVDNMVSLLMEAIAHRIPFIVENPRSSLMWYDRAMRKLAAQPGVHAVDFHMCGYGTR